MATSSGPGPSSMRFQLHEVMSGMLASIASDSFIDDSQRIAAMFEQLAARFALFTPLAAGVNPAAVSKALQTLEANKLIERGAGRYVLTPAGRAHCIRSKQTLFNRRDIEQLEEAARVFDTL